MNTKEVNDVESRIIEAAKQVFIRKGYEATTMGDIASEVGIGRTTLHYYFRTKEILFESIVGGLVSSLLPNIDRIMDEDSRMLDKLPAIIGQYMEVICRNPMFPMFVVSEMNRDPEHLYRSIFKDPGRIKPVMRMKNQLVEEMESGLLRKMPVIDVVSTIVSLVVFPTLVRKPLCAALLGGASEQFEIFMERRKELIIEIVAQMLSPEVDSLDT